MFDFGPPQNIFSEVIPDVQRIRALLDEELVLFDHDLKSGKDRSYTDLRGALISWFAIFFSDIITRTFEQKLANYCAQLRTDDMYESDLWHRLFHLNVAVAGEWGITSDEQPNLASIDYPDDDIRKSALESLCFVGHRLESYEWFGRKHVLRIHSAIEESHPLASQALRLFAVLDDDSEKVRKELLKIKGAFRDKIEPETGRVIEELLTSGKTGNQFFHAFGARIQRYVLMRLASVHAVPYNLQWEIFPDKSFPSESPDTRFKDTAARSWSILENHPLLGPEIVVPELCISFGDRSASNNIKRETILIVEDDDTMLRWLATAIADRGYNVISARDGEEGLHAFENCYPALVVTNVHMPRMNGFVLLNAIKQIKQETPIILTSGTAWKEGELLVKTGKADAFFEKPFVMGELLGRISELLKEKREAES